MDTHENVVLSGAAELPVVIVTVGYPAAGNWPQKPRKHLSEVLTIV